MINWKILKKLILELKVNDILWYILKKNGSCYEVEEIFSWNFSGKSWNLKWRKKSATYKKFLRYIDIEIFRNYEVSYKCILKEIILLLSYTNFEKDEIAEAINLFAEPISGS